MTYYYLRTLFVHSAGTRLILDGDSVKALRDDSPPRRLPLNAIDSLIAFGGVDVSTPLLTRCAEDGRTVAFLSSFGKPRAVVLGTDSGRGALRLAQYRAHLDVLRRSELAVSFVEGKRRQMLWALRQWARAATGEARSRLRRQADLLETYSAKLATANRDTALGLEGAMTRAYFEGLNLALMSHQWPGRAKRPPTDPVNATLSFLYGMARAAAHGGVHAAGLDPYAGFLHGDRSDQPSLVLDLLEEFRPGVDRLVTKLFNLEVLKNQHFDQDVSGAVHLTDQGREILLQAWHDWRGESVRVQGFREPIPRAALPGVQATRLALALRTGSRYEPHRYVVT